jgi:hypothetical protein
MHTRAMKSPFPGMDPYLERHWGDVHQSFITYARNALQRVLPEDLRARTEERIYVEQEESEGRHIIPDVSIISSPPPWSAEKRESEAGGVAVAEAVLVARTGAGRVHRDSGSGRRAIDNGH